MRLFGNQLGNSLYDKKSMKNKQKVKNKKIKRKKKKTILTLFYFSKN